ncbi:MAG: regulatory iron-sulfur-containing complex subunit RicT [Bacteroidia bacterium]
MGCSSCSTATGSGSPAGCRNNGTCGTGGCNKLNVYNWLADMHLPEGQKPFDIVEVRFKGSRKEFYRNSNNLDLHVGDMVAVEGNPGHDIGEVSMVGELVRFQLRKRSLKEDSHEIKTLYRLAKEADIEKWKEVKNLEFTTMHGSRTTALQLGLKMKLSDVEYQGDGKKATFFYTADDRVDFRELIKRLADQFKVRIEMRQIGMRQEAARLGGIGSCGRELCCSTWLSDFKVVSTSAARYQNLSLNPIKLAGQCGKLKCCLNYELDTYMDAVRDIPESNVKLQTGKGIMVHRKTDIFKRIMWYNLIPEVKEGEERGFVPEQWVPMSVDRVKEIIAMNKAGQRPDDFGAMDLDEDEDDLGYDDVVGQDSLTRMDRKKKKKKKKKDDRGNKPGATAPKAIAQGTADGAKGPSQPSSQQQGNRPPRQQGDGRPQRNDGNRKPDGNKPQGQKPGGENRPQQPAGAQQNSGNRPPRQPVGNDSSGSAQGPKPATGSGSTQGPKPQTGNGSAQGPKQQTGNRPPRQAAGGGNDQPGANRGQMPAPGNDKPAPENNKQAPDSDKPSGNRPPRRAPGSDSGNAS